MWFNALLWAWINSRCHRPILIPSDLGRAIADVRFGLQKLRLIYRPVTTLAYHSSIAESRSGSQAARLPLRTLPRKTGGSKHHRPITTATGVLTCPYFVTAKPFLNASSPKTKASFASPLAWSTFLRQFLQQKATGIPSTSSAVPCFIFPPLIGHFS